MKFLDIKTKMARLPLGLLTFGLAITLLSADKKAYQIFGKKGQPISYHELVKTATKADIVLFGEMHNNPICHWLELNLTKSLDQKLDSNKLILGAEMFERDDQMKLREYWQGLISQSHFEREAKLWDNYSTDYKPLVEYAKKNAIPFHATNIPRRYAGFVAKKGPKVLDTFGHKAKSYFPPLPANLNMDLGIYQKLKEMKMHGHEAAYMAEAQAIKDATMAHFILEHYQKGQTFLHFNGNHHSKNHEGINWYLKEFYDNGELDIVTIGSVEQPKVKELAEANQNMANYTIAVPSDMTKTY